MSSDVGESSVYPADPAGAHERDASSRQTASVPPTVVEPSAPCTTQAARSRGADLARGRARLGEPVKLGAVQPDPELPSMTPIVAGTAPAALTRASAARRRRVPGRRRTRVRPASSQGYDRPAARRACATSS